MSTKGAVLKTLGQSLTGSPTTLLGLSALLFTGVGCQGMDSYDSFRRHSSTFQVADGPVYRYKIADGSDDHMSSERMKRGQDLQFPQARRAPMDLSPEYRLPTMDLEMDSAKDHSGIQSELPKRDVTVNMNDRDVQYLLQQLGLYSGELDGKRGPMTTAAIKKFQQSKNLTVDGVAGRQTKSALVKALQQKMSQNF